MTRKKFEKILRKNKEFLKFRCIYILMDKNDVWFNFMEELRSRSDLVSVVSSYVNLDRKGNRFWACCPFHHEKTPSFCVSPEMQRYKCFGCGESGDVIKFIEKYENVDFMSAVELLAKRAGLEMPRLRGDKGLQEKKKRKQAMAEICLFAAKFYRSNLMTKNGAFAVEYLKNRGLDDRTIARFGIGLSPDWDSLVTELEQRGMDVGLAYECGVLDKRTSGRYFDAMGERLIIPIINAMGEVIAFGGRSMKKEIDFAKYKNTKQTELFDKSKNLFGINLVSKKKKKSGLDRILVVEGYMDAIALHQAGFDFAVASMGTSLTKEQARLMKRYADRVYICYDGDAAGTKGTLRGLEILKAEGLEVRVMSMPDGIDPDELILKYGREAFSKAMDEALPLTDYKLAVERKKYDFDRGTAADREDAKRKYTMAALDIISSLDNLVEAESYIIKLSKETGFSPDWLKQSLTVREADAVAVTDTARSGEEQMAPLNRYDKALYFILACMLAGEEYAVIDFEPVTNDVFLKESFRYVAECAAQGKKPVPSVLADIFDGQYSKNLDYLADTVFSTTLENKKYFADCVKLVKKKYIADEINRLSNEYTKEADNGRRSEIAAEIQRLSAETKKL